jgi:hypothetical protein
MQINRVLFCLNNNPIYTGFWNINSKIWSEKYNLKTTLFFVGDQTEFNNLNLSKNFGEVFFLPNLKQDLSNGSKRNWLVTWSLFYGATLFPNEVCLTSGIDQIPLGNHIFELADRYSDKYLISFSDAYNKLENLFPSSHHIALGSDFKKIFEIEDNWEEEALKVFNSKTRYKTLASDFWGLDEAYSSDMILKKRNENIVFVKDFFSEWSHRRIDGRKDGMGYNKELLKKGYYSELHALRPYEQYKSQIDDIVFNCHNIRI